MKSKLLMLALIIGLLSTGSALAQNDPFDPFGIMDTVALEIVGDPATGTFQLELYAFTDEFLAGGTMGFQWTTTNPVFLVAADTTSVTGDAGCDLGVFFFEQADTALTNTNQRFLFGCLAAFSGGVAPDATTRRLWATYTFETTGWTAEDVITFDTLTFDGSSEYLLTEWDTNTELIPVFEGAVTGNTENPVDDNLPTSYALNQNYPNPFNPTTQIAFDLPARSHVRLTVYNILGQEVATLLDEERDAGFNQVVTWDASSKASGVYFYKLEADSFTETRKMLLLK